ncbi:tripartite tricarboxylate transporter TctB family protein [Thermovenabulum gondwanense]|uniref:DUF1468 domain-containing protein n=1 Tax=Thermovenabulum gondwanense TaxID=520767 RepID=A0A162N375_9FIRM|nr:tripartite tricarboxylate transporter TctB family protein [Thermovenabulum gondwanense]KYO68730.1 hypothetical protein ATZ99_02490 [Thermovenabulum gondwanense]
MDYSKLLDVISIILASIICFLVFFNLYTISSSQNIPLISVESPIIFPFLIGITLLILLLIIIFEQSKFWKNYREDSEYRKNVINELKDVLFYFAGLVIYISFLKKLHFNVSTIIFTACVMILLARKELNLKKIFQVILSSVGLVLVIDFVFSGIFKIILP